MDHKGVKGPEKSRDISGLHVGVPEEGDDDDIEVVEVVPRTIVPTPSLEETEAGIEVLSIRRLISVEPCRPNPLREQVEASKPLTHISSDVKEESPNLDDAEEVKDVRAGYPTGPGTARSGLGEDLSQSKNDLTTSHEETPGPSTSAKQNNTESQGLPVPPTKQRAPVQVSYYSEDLSDLPAWKLVNLSNEIAQHINHLLPLSSFPKPFSQPLEYKTVVIFEDPQAPLSKMLGYFDDLGGKQVIRSAASTYKPILEEKVRKGEIPYNIKLPTGEPLTFEQFIRKMLDDLKPEPEAQEDIAESEGGENQDSFYRQFVQAKSKEERDYIGLQNALKFIKAHDDVSKEMREEEDKKVDEKKRFKEQRKQEREIEKEALIIAGSSRQTRRAFGNCITNQSPSTIQKSPKVVVGNSPMEIPLQPQFEPEAPSELAADTAMDDVPMTHSEKSTSSRLNDAGEISNWGSKKGYCEAGHWYVERVLDCRMAASGAIEYLIKWKEWPDTFNSWEPEDQLECQELMNEYLRMMHLQIAECNAKVKN